MNAKRKAQIRAEHDRRISRLPEWLQNVDDYVTYRLTHDVPRHRDADEWIQHGADMLTKIQQLLDVQEGLLTACKASRVCLLTHPNRNRDTAEVVELIEAAIAAAEAKGEDK